MNTTAVAIAALKAKRDRLLAEIEPLNTAIQALGGGSGKTKARAGGGWPKGKPRGPKKAMTEAQKAGLLKAQEARRAKLAAGKANGGEGLANQDSADSGQATPIAKKGASLSQSA